MNVTYELIRLHDGRHLRIWNDGDEPITLAWNGYRVGCVLAHADIAVNVENVIDDLQKIKDWNPWK